MIGNLLSTVGVLAAAVLGAWLTRRVCRVTTAAVRWPGPSWRGDHCGPGAHHGGCGGGLVSIVRAAPLSGPQTLGHGNIGAGGPRTASGVHPLHRLPLPERRTPAPERRPGPDPFGQPSAPAEIRAARPDSRRSAERLVERADRAGDPRRRGSRWTGAAGHGRRGGCALSGRRRPPAPARRFQDDGVEKHILPRPAAAAVGGVTAKI